MVPSVTRTRLAGSSILFKDRSGAGSFPRETDVFTLVSISVPASIQYQTESRPPWSTRPAWTQLGAIEYPVPSKTGDTLVTGYWLLVTGYWLLATGYWLLVTGYWLLVTGYWLLATGYWWLLVTGYWLLATGFM